MTLQDMLNPQHETVKKTERIALKNIQTMKEQLV
jgi:hypothetical protein